MLAELYSNCGMILGYHENMCRPKDSGDQKVLQYYGHIETNVFVWYNSLH